MKLWLLTRSDRIGWDEYVGFVVRAPDEIQARALAIDRAGDEGEETWANPMHSMCTVVGADEGDEVPGILLDSFNAG